MFEEDLAYLAGILKTIPAAYLKDPSGDAPSEETVLRPGASKHHANKKGAPSRPSTELLRRAKLDPVFSDSLAVAALDYGRKEEAHAGVARGAQTASDLKHRVARKIEELRVKRKAPEKQGTSKSRKVDGAGEERKKDGDRSTMGAGTASKLRFIDTRKQKEEKRPHTVRAAPQEQTLQKLKERISSGKKEERKEEACAWAAAVKRASGERIADPKKIQKRKADRERKKAKSRKAWGERLAKGKEKPNRLLRRPGFEGVAFNKSGQ